ncbi:MAG: peptide chain release factor N(5)-glutamine methyltransferase [Desulfobacteraceae bacterium]|nr:peptide chain release factor N(5)-glutamine methyltransferase [Desulfobacteraceae bacterium]
MRNHNLQKPQTWTVLDALQWTAGFFHSRNIDSPRLTAELLLAEVMGVGRIDLYIRHDQPLSEAELASYREMIRRRVKREPVAYILASTEFWGLPFSVTPGVLIPRPETEHLVEAALARLPQETTKKKRIIDLGTGSGAIVVSLAVERPGNVYFAVDKSWTALQVAKKNAGLNGAAERICFFAGDWLDAVNPAAPGFDIIVSNPPYVASDDIAGLQPEISRYEPRMAIDGRKDGLEAIRLIVCKASEYLVQEGFLLLEIGYDQKSAVEDLCRRQEVFGSIEFIKDYAGHYRVAVLQKR